MHPLLTAGTLSEDTWTTLPVHQVGFDIALVEITSPAAHHFVECVWYVGGFSGIAAPIRKLCVL